MNKQPHKYSDVIKAWADGELVQWSSNGVKWHDAESPSFDSSNCFWRIKPTSFVQEFRVALIAKWNHSDECGPAIIDKNAYDTAMADERFICWLTDPINYETMLVNQV